MIHYDPSVIQVEEVRNGGFLSGGTQEIAVVQRIDQQQGRSGGFGDASAEHAGRERHRDGFGFRGARRGSGNREAANSAGQCHDSQQQTIPMVSGEATIQVQ